jgi:short-subunit dehydrogenase
MHRKSMIITGASKGIGEALSLHFGKKGYNLLLIARTEARLEKIKKKILSTDSNQIIHYLPMDICYPEPLQVAIDAFYHACGGIDVLINNAGSVKRGTSTISPEAIDEMVNVNLIGAINMVRHIVPKMMSHQSGYIINICSRNAKIPRSFLGGYAATKAALLAYSGSLYKELSAVGIKVTALCPGFIDTEMTKDLDIERDRLISLIDICKTIEFILSLSSSVAIKELDMESIDQVGGYC